MARLQHSELAGFSDSLAVLYSAGDMGSLSTRVIRCLRRLFDCDLASFDLIDLSAVQWNTVIISPIVSDWPNVVEILQHHAHEHPIVTHAARANYPHAIRTSDLVSLRQYRQRGIYQDFFRPYIMAVDRQLGFVSRPSDGLTLGVSVNRRGRDFSTGQRELLERLRPHLSQAYAAAQKHSQLMAAFARERERTGVVAGGGLCEVDDFGRVRWATAKVESLFARYFPNEARRGDRLPASLLTRLEEVVARRRANDPDSPVRWSWRWVCRYKTLRLYLTRSTEDATWQLLLTEDDADDPKAAELEVRHGVTPRQSEILYWIGQGKTNEEIGLILQIARRTVYKHVEAIFARLGVYNRTAAARLALER